jgi:hypothetical protein
MPGRSHRRPSAVGYPAIVLTAFLCGLFGAGTTASAQPSSIAPPPSPVIGPLQYGPPAYPPTVGVPLLPKANSGVGVAADTLAPTAPASASAPAGGIAGVVASADVLSPFPSPGAAQQAPGAQ